MMTNDRAERSLIVCLDVCGPIGVHGVFGRRHDGGTNEREVRQILSEQNCRKSVIKN